jgi:hypothetical protein
MVESVAQEKQSELHASVVDREVYMEGVTARSAVVDVTSDDGWAYQLRFERRRLTELCVTAPEGKTITARSHRAVNVGRLERCAAKALASYLHRLNELFGNRDARLISAATEHFRGDPGALDLEALAALAWLYELESTESPHGAKALAAQLNVKPQRLYAHLRSAKQHGLLDGYTQGRPGGVLTARGHELLAHFTKDAE